MRRASCRVVMAATLVTLAALACSEVGTDPSIPVAIQLSPSPLPSIVVGDSMRDSTGAAVPLQATVFNFRNDVIPDAPIRFLALDSARRFSVDSTTGFVVANDTGQATVVATSLTLQSAPITLIAVVRPGTMLALDSLRDSLHYAFTGRDTLHTFRVRVVQISGTDTIPVPSYLVHYAFAYPAGLDNTDSTAVQLVDDTRRPSLADTTDATGTANRSLRITPNTRAFSDSVVVQVTAAEPNGAAVPGSPIRYVLRVQIE